MNLSMIPKNIRGRGQFPQSMAVVQERWTTILLAQSGMSHDQLADKGVNVELLAICIKHELVVTEEIPATIERMGVSDFNSSLEHLRDRVPAILAHPDSLLDQSLHLHETHTIDGGTLCSCGTEYCVA